MNDLTPIEKPLPRNELRVVEDRIAVFDTAHFEHMQRVATLMATCNLVPDALKGKMADCFLVVNQARNWNMDPFSVAQCTSIVSGKLCFEGKLVAAAIASDAALQGPLNYKFSGTGDARKVVVSGRLKGEVEDRIVEGTVSQWRTKNDQWTKDPDQMLVYRGARQWARRHKPDRLLGVYAPDEFDEEQGERWPRREPRNVTPPPAPPAPPPAPPAAPVAQSAPSAPAAPPPVPVIEDAQFELVPPTEAPPADVKPAKSYDEKIEDWKARLKAADFDVQAEIFEEIEIFRESGELFPPDYAALKSLVKDS